QLMPPIQSPIKPGGGCFISRGTPPPGQSLGTAGFELALLVEHWLSSPHQCPSIICLFLQFNNQNNTHNQSKEKPTSKMSKMSEVQYSRQLAENDRLREELDHS